MNPVQFKVSPVGDKDIMNQVKGMTVFNTEVHDAKKQPMFFGKPLGVQRYDTYKYPVFEKLTTQQLGYFWRPEEVSLQKDRGDYQSLRPEQKHIYTSNLKYQIMLDSIQGRGPGMAFIPYCSLPELEACMEVWGFMEMIHSRSYTYIIKNIYPNPADVLDKIVTDQKILDRAKSVTESYDDFINTAQVWGTTGMWSADFRGSPSTEYEIKEVKRKLYRAVANVNILEGIRFYVSFACSFAFGELKLRKDFLELGFINHITCLTLKSARIASILISKITQPQITLCRGPLNESVPTPMTIIVRNSSTSLTNVGIELAFLFNVTHDRCQGISICDSCLGL